MDGGGSRKVDGEMDERMGKMLNEKMDMGGSMDERMNGW